jgi:hypothetical protein
MIQQQKYPAGRYKANAKYASVKFLYMYPSCIAAFSSNFVIDLCPLKGQNQWQNLKKIMVFAAKVALQARAMHDWSAINGLGNRHHEIPQTSGDQCNESMLK